VYSLKLAAENTNSSTALSLSAVLAVLVNMAMATHVRSSNVLKPHVGNNPTITQHFFLASQLKTRLYGLFKHILFKYLNIRIIQNAPKKEPFDFSSTQKLETKQRDGTLLDQTQDGAVGDWERSHIADVRDTRLNSRLRIGS